MKTLKNVETFGAVDADNDDLLFQAFEGHEAFDDLISFKKFLIIGRKGSGKTALFKKLLTIREHDTFTFGYTFSDYPWHHHDLQAQIGIPELERYVHSWKYLILLSMAKLLLNQDASIPWDDETLDIVSRVEQFVIDTYGTRDPDVYQIFTPTKRLKLKPHFELDWRLIKAGISPESVPMECLPQIVQELNRTLADYIIKAANPANKYYIAFDQLDLRFDPNDSKYADRLIGLLLAARDINLQAKNNGKNVAVSIFLRNDIFSLLHFEDKNKLTMNFQALIEWDTPRTTKSLKGLMEKRFTTVLSGNGGVVSWEDVFEEEKLMTGKQSKYQHILDRTFLRPRDVIQFCNEILKQYKKRIESSGGECELRFANQDVNLAKDEYSRYFRNELDDEIHKHIPDYNNYFEIFKTIGCLQFSREQFMEAFETHKKKFADKQDPLDILQKLFEFSVVGFYRAGGKGYGGSEYVYKYKDEDAQFDQNAETFRIHPALMEYLGLKKYSRTT